MYGISYSKQAKTCRNVSEDLDTTDKNNLEQNFKVRCIVNIQTVLSKNR